LFSTGIKVSKAEWERLKKNAEKDSPDGKIKDDNFLDVWHKLWSRETDSVGIVPFARNITRKLVRILPLTCSVIYLKIMGRQKLCTNGLSQTT